MDKLTRRQFLRKKGQILFGLGTTGVLAGVFKMAEAEAKAYIRPPGALPEEDFLKRCIRCGQCGQSCPYFAIRYVDWSGGIAADTPNIVPSYVACQLCMTCNHVCPSGALQKIEDTSKEVIKETVKMGVAFNNRVNCYAWNNRSCGYCYWQCPLREEAIKLIEYERPVINEEVCVGCGICEKVCISNPKGMRIIPKGGTLESIL